MSATPLIKTRCRSKVKNLDCFPSFQLAEGLGPVVILSPNVVLFLGILQGKEPIRMKALFPEGTVEIPVKVVLCWFSVS